MDYVLNIIPQMMDGCLVSFQVFIITIVLSIPLGILLSLGRVSGIKPLQALIGGYVLFTSYCRPSASACRTLNRPS